MRAARQKASLLRLFRMDARRIMPHRAGVGGAFAGTRVEDRVEKVEQRWGGNA